MIYNLVEPKEVKAARNRLSYLVRKKARVSIVEKLPGRTLNQNSYLHLLLADFGLHFGYTLEEAKTIYKRAANPTLYVYENNGAKFLRSSADLNKDEMAQSIDRFMQFSSEQGHDLPPADNEEWRSLIENEMERNRRYL